MLVKNFFSINKYHLIVLATVWLLVHIFLFWNYGIRNLYDANGYIKGADFLLEHGKPEDIHHLFYIVPISFIAFSRWLFPGQIIPFLVFQCILSGIAAIALYRAASKIFNNTLAGLLSALIFLLWLDNIQWNTTAMTESIACSFICLMIYRLVLFQGIGKDYLWIGVLMLVIFFTRPTGVVVIVGAFAFLLKYYWTAIKNNGVLKYSIIASVIVIGYVGAASMFRHWDFSEQYLKGNIVTYMHTLEGNELYDASLRMEPPPGAFIDIDKSPIERIFHFVIHNPLYFIKTSALKIWYLISATRPYYSKLHNLYNIVWMIFIYSTFWLGLRSVVKNPIVVFTVVVILVNCGIIGLSAVDWDNRFYIPMEPGIVLLAGGGAAYCLNQLRLEGLRDKFTN